MRKMAIYRFGAVELKNFSKKYSSEPIFAKIGQEPLADMSRYLNDAIACDFFMKKLSLAWRHCLQERYRKRHGNP